MNPNLPVLPDSIGYLLVAFGVAAVVVYLKETIADIKVARRERKVREFEAAVRADKVSRQLADYYTAAANGDPEDFDYWEETAKQFKGEVK